MPAGHGEPNAGRERASGVHPLPRGLLGRGGGGYMHPLRRGAFQRGSGRHLCCSVRGVPNWALQQRWRRCVQL